MKANEINPLLSVGNLVVSVRNRARLGSRSVELRPNDWMAEQTEKIGETVLTLDKFNLNEYT